MSYDFEKTGTHAVPLQKHGQDGHATKKETNIQHGMSNVQEKVEMGEEAKTR